MDDVLGKSVKAAATTINVLAWLTPRNLAGIRLEIQSQLESGGDRIAEWCYDEFDAESAYRSIAEARVQLKRARRGPALSALVSRTLDRFEDAARAISLRDDTTFSEWDERAYGKPTRSDLNRAAVVLEGTGPETNPARVYSSDEVANVVDIVLARFGLKQWTVEMIPNSAARMSVRPLTRTIRVQSNTLFSTPQLNRLLVHEVGSHVFRAANSQSQPEALAAVSLGEPQPTEEGLAVWAEVQVGVSDPTIMRVYAARALAASVSKTAGILEVIRAIEPLIGRSAATAVAIRSKRGLRDPNGDGGLSKDHGYWSGYLSIEEHLSSFPDDYPLLMATKWSLSELELVRRMERDGELLKGTLLPLAADFGITET
jgi:hypothetical protein